MVRTRFDKQLECLNNELISMGTLIEKAIEMAVDALINQDVEKAKIAMSFDDEVDKKEGDIEALCLKLILQQQPVASDLRTISSALKMITDMERIADHAVDISELTIEMAGLPYIKRLNHIKEMAKETTLMLISSIDAYVNKDRKSVV